MCVQLSGHLVFVMSRVNMKNKFDGEVSPDEYSPHAKGGRYAMLSRAACLCNPVQLVVLARIESRKLYFKYLSPNAYIPVQSLVCTICASHESDLRQNKKFRF